jgi:antitoxin component YwqK of YwqJK toxin-antitoxin module
MWHYLIILAFIASMSVCKAQDKNTKITYYPNSVQKKWQGQYENGVPTGEFIYYYPDGKIKGKSVYSQNAQVMHSIFYHNFPTIAGVGEYVKNQNPKTQEDVYILQGLWRFYDNAGRLISEENYLLGKKNGEEKIYYSNGQISHHNQWQDGQKAGWCLEYFENGQLKEKAFWQDLNYQGEVLRYHPNGKLQMQGKYENGVKEGVWKVFDDNDTLENSYHYRNGYVLEPKPK